MSHHHHPRPQKECFECDVLALLSNILRVETQSARSLLNIEQILSRVYPEKRIPVSATFVVDGPFPETSTKK